MMVDWEPCSNAAHDWLTSVIATSVGASPVERESMPYLPPTTVTPLKEPPPPLPPATPASVSGAAYTVTSSSVEP